MVGRRRPESIGIILFSGLLVISILTGLGNGQELKDPGKAKIHFLGHCGFAVQTENYFMIFDYVEKSLEGQYQEPEIRSLETGYVIPGELKDLKVRVFVTHRHTDHYDEIIYSWEGVIPDIEYFFGWQASEESRYHYLVAPRAEWKDDDMRIYTVNSHHSGVPEVAYLVLVDGLAIYHNGDCKVNPEDDIAYLKSRADHLDLAFVPPVWEEKWDYFRLTAALINQLKPKVIFPMHVRVGDEEKFFEPFKNTFQPKMEGGQVVLTMNEKGSAYLYDKGKISGPLR